MNEGMNWLTVVEQLLGVESGGGVSPESWDLGADAHYEYDEQGVTVFSDLDGDGQIDQVSRMEFSGHSCTLSIDDGGWGSWIEESPERGEENEGWATQAAVEYPKGWG